MYKANKIGLLNFWFYDEEEFDFYDGKLLLRGQNGSGKSVTMQSFIPLILDGNKSPKRLDTFGSVDKHIEYYLLGDKDSKDDSTGYLYMEFYNKKEEKYITIGIGLRAKRGKPTEFFGFALKDGRRINKDFFLYKNKDGLHKTPFTKLELKAALGIENQIVEKQSDYKKMVNDLLFKFPSISQYDEFINILLQIRSPKLSKDYKPSKLMEILNDVLPPLAEEDLKPLSDTIESLNQTKEKIDDLNHKIQLLNNFIKVYHNYNEMVLYQKCTDYLESTREVTELETNHQTLLSDISKTEGELASLKDKENELEIEYQKALYEIENLDNKDLEDKTKQLVVIEQSLDNLRKRLVNAQDSLTVLKEKLSLTKDEISKHKFELDNMEKKLDSLLAESIDTGNELKFDNYVESISMIFQSNESYAYIRGLIDEKAKAISLVKSLLEQQNEILSKQNEAQQQLDLLKKESFEKEELKNKTIQDLDLELEQFVKEIIRLAHENQHLKILDLDLKEMLQYLQDYSKENVAKVKEKYEAICHDIYLGFMNELTTQQMKYKVEEENYQTLQQELEDLLLQKEIVFQENDLQSETIGYLKEQNIDYLSFYQAVDFKDNVSEEKANKIEEMLYSAGILNAKIFLEKDILKIKDKNISYLCRATKKKKNLSTYLKPVVNDVIDTSVIMAILESISIDGDDLVNLQDTDFQFDFLKGFISKNYQSQYIGIINRRRKHEELVEELKNKLKLVETKKNSLQSLIFAINDKMTKLFEERDSFPLDETLYQLDCFIKDYEREITFLHDREREFDLKIRDYQKRWQELLMKIQTHRDNIPLNLEKYQEASYLIEEISKQFLSITSLHDQILAKKELLLSNEARLDDIVVNHDDVYGMILNYQTEEQNLLMEQDVIKKLLNTEEFVVLSQKLKENQTIVKNYPNAKAFIANKIGLLTSDLNKFSRSIDKSCEQIDEAKLLLDVCERILIEEVHLGYVIQEEQFDKSKVVNLKKSLENSGTKNMDNALGNYYRAYTEYRQHLMDYGITDVILFKDRDSLVQLNYEKNSHLNKDKLDQYFNRAERRDIVANYQGKKMNLYLLRDSLKDAYEADKIFLNEQDRHLFEDILLQTIGGKIKEKIIEAQEWVKKINEIMFSKQKESNLSFLLDWKPKSQEVLEEMDTKKLVDIFMLPESSVEKADKERLVKHFRSKIARAEEFLEESKNSYFEMIFEILDYRNWFTFKLFYKKDGNDKKELTDRIFSVFSGGEKAKTMYIPLFASVNAKLDVASSDAPRIIALDEAFAGVDDKNIEEMFGILKSFQLDYLLTSQALWCTYSVIDDIAISELIRPINQTTVAVKRFRWNGKNKEIVLKENIWNI